jgi:hypothetical protein
MSRKAVKVIGNSMFWSFIFNINTYISITYTESTVRNIIPKGNYKRGEVQDRATRTVRNIIPKGNYKWFDFDPFRNYIKNK